MWDSKIPHANCNWEPVELRMLKKELASIHCNCSACETYREPAVPIYQNDVAVQVERVSKSLEKFIYSNEPIPGKRERSQNINNIMEFVRDDVYCPNCYLIWQLLRGFTKTLKDEECETAPHMFFADKSTEKDVLFVDSTTSIKNVTGCGLTSSLTLCDFISPSSSKTSLYFHCKPKNNCDRVTFLDDHINECNNRQNKVAENPLHGTCFCMENFIDSIRPPL